MRTAIIIVSVVIVLAIGIIIGLVVWHNRTCADKFEKAVALESTTRDELLKALRTEDPYADPDRIYASPEFETIIKMYEEVTKECKNYSQSALVSLERLKKSREIAEAMVRSETEEKKIASELGIDYVYLKNFPEGARINYYYGDGNQETIDFTEYVCLKYSDSLHGQYQDVFDINLKTPLKEGPADYFIKTEIIIPSGLEKNKYVSIGNFKDGDSPAKNQVYLNLYLPEYINYKGKKIFFKMNDLVSNSGHIVVLDPLEKEEGDRVKLLGKDIPVVKKPDQSGGGRVSLELNIVCHTVFK